MLRKVLLGFMVLIAVLPFAPTATAGGWAAVSLVSPLESVTVGEETTIQYKVLAHARPEAPMTGMEVDFLFMHEFGYFVAASGQATADPAVYEVTFTLEQPGSWELRSMTRNYGDLPTINKFPTVVASITVDTAGS